MPKFIPPVAYDNPPVLPETKGVERRLFRHYGPYRRGRSVLKLNGVYVTMDNPSQLDLKAATEVYLGGRVYEITAAKADELTAAGYQVWAELTWGDYEVNQWGQIQGTPWGAL